MSHEADIVSIILDIMSLTNPHKMLMLGIVNHLPV